MARILIVEHHVLVRRLLWQILTDAGYEIVGEVEDGLHAVARFTDLVPDLVLLGLAPTGRRELGTLQQMLRIEPSVPVLVCATADDVDAAHEAVQLGAIGFIVKPFARDTVLSAVRHAACPPVVLRSAAVELPPR